MSDAIEALALLRRMAAAPPTKRSYFTGAEAAELLRMIEKPAAPQSSKEQVYRRALDHCKPESISAFLADLDAIGECRESPPLVDRDHRAMAGVAACIIRHLQTVGKRLALEKFELKGELRASAGETTGDSSPVKTPVLTGEKPGCPIHGPCPVCSAERILGDPRIGVTLVADAGSIFRVGAVPHGAAVQVPGVFQWMCTKHGNIPFHDCGQCERERSALKSTGESCG